MKQEQPIGESYAAAGLCKSISALAKEEATLLQTAVALPPALQARAGLHPHRRECEEQLTSYVFNSIPHSPEHQPSSLLPASSGHKADNLNFLPPLAGGQFDQQPNGFQLHPVASPTHKGSEQLDHEHNSDSDSEDEGAKPKRPAGTQQCPRCNSNNTKFCYYNNYNVKQPRYYCRDCQRYWTMGGSLRQIAPGAGRRKPKAEKCKVKAADQHDNHPTAVEVAATAASQQLTPSEQETALYQPTNVAVAATVSGGLQQQQILNQAVAPAKELMVPLGVVQSAALTAQPEALAAVAAAAAASLPALAQHMALTGALQANSLDLNLLAGTPAAAAAGADAMLQQQQQGQGSDMCVGQLLYPAGTDPATANANAAAALGGIHPLLATGLMPGLAGLLPAAAGALPGPTEMPTAWQTAALASAAAAASGMDPLTSLTAIVAAIAAAGQQQQQGQQSQIGAAMAALTAAGLMPRGLDLTAAAAAAVQGGPAAAAAAALGLLNPPSYEQQQQQVAAMAGLQGMLLGAPQLPTYQQQQQQQLQQQQQQQLRQQHKQAQQQLELQQLLQGYSHVNMPLGQQQPAAAMQMADAPSLAAAATAHHTPSAAAADADGAGDRSDALERRVKPRLQQPVESSPQDQAAAKQQQQSSPGVQEVAVAHAVQPEEATTGAGLQQSPGFQIQTSPAAADLTQQQQSQQQQQQRRVGTMGPPPPHKPQQQQQQATLHHQQQSLLPTNTPDLAQQLQQQGVLQQLQSAFGGAAGADWGRIAQQGVLNPAILAAAAASGSQVTSPTAAVAAAAEKQLAAAAVAANSQLTADQNGVTQLAAALQVQAAAMQLAHAHAQVNASAAAQALQAAIAASGMPLQAALGSLNPAAAGDGDVAGCWDALNSSLSLGHLLQQQQVQANQQQQLAVSQQQQQQQLAAGQMDALGVAAAAAALGNGNAWQQQQATGDAAAALVVARYMAQQMAAAAAPAYAGMG